MVLSIKIKIAELRRMKKVSQQELADYLGVTFQSVSKWETKTTLPDITLLPLIAEYFGVSVDEVLGLKPIKSAAYQPRDTDNRDNWVGRENIFNNRKFFWNEEYLLHLIKEVWKIEKPIDVIEMRCGNGELGKIIMPLLPKGSTYTGVDNKYFIEKARNNMHQEIYKVSFLESDIYNFKTKTKYDFCICEATLRHMNKPLEVIEKMKEAVKDNGLVVCAEINREIENVGLYVEGMDYNELCTSFDWHKLWLKELEKEGRDYGIGMRVPFYMKKIGLKDIDVRMNDKVSFVTPDCENYSELCEEFAALRGFDRIIKGDDEEQTIEFFMSRGYTRNEMERYCEFHNLMTRQFKQKNGQLSFLQLFGFLISYGRK
jgi:Predicted transcriptional regulators